MTTTKRGSDARKLLASGGFPVTADRQDFLADDFDRVGEPLNLLENGRTWFANVYRAHRRHDPGQALILGVTPWLGRLAAEYCQQVLLADRSAAMVAWAARHLDLKLRNCRMVQTQWLKLELPGVDLVCGDNSFSFVRFPEGWSVLGEKLHDACRDNAQLYLRFISAPEGFAPAATEALVAEALRQSSINYTAFRAAYMLAKIERGRHYLDMDAIVERFNGELDLLAPLAEKFGLPEGNDLVTIRKYAGTGTKLYVPPVEAIIEVFAPWFRAVDVVYGPIPLARHFPLIVFEKNRPRAPG